MQDEAFKILIVDDDPIQRESLEEILSLEGYQIHCAADGKSAQALICQVFPDLILLDVMMPDMDGFTLCRLLRQDPAVAEVPIVMITALDDRKARLTGIEAGADEFLNKPVDILELRTRVKTLSRLNRYRRLQIERSKFEAVVWDAEIGYLIVDGDKTIQYANKRAGEYLTEDQGRTNILGENFAQLLSAFYSVQVEPEWDRADPALAAILTYHVARPATQHHPIRYLTVKYLRNFAEPSGTRWLISLQDVTLEMHMAHEIYSFQRMVNHKLRTALSVIMLSSEILNQLDDMDAAMIRSVGRDLHQASLDMRRKMESVLRIADLDQLFEHGDMSTLAEWIELLTSRVTARGLPPLQADIQVAEACLGWQGLLPRESVDLICTELVENAQKYHPQMKPQICLCIGHGTEGQITLQVKDDGQGLPPGMPPSQFLQPYYQFERFFTGNVRGMGLGLTIIAGLVWRVGGGIQIYNRADGPGAVVEMALPFEEL
jgi:DNA-binding response OmpR family regulator